jgi:LmbE family N-acetylglucosaminyl deacetylase
MGGTRRFAHIYLSPHLDDAVLSCGGRVAQQVRTGASVAVVSIFAGVPETPLSSYAKELHARWDQPVGAAGQRQKEDEEALALLGAEAVHWRYGDCVYRTTPEGSHLYTREESLWGQIHPSEAGLIQELTDRMGSLPLEPEGVLYAPLGVGQHVDHRIVRRAAEGCGRHLIYYEDFPYAAEPGKVRDAVSAGQWTSELVYLSQEALEAKIAAVARYRSQISTFWEGEAEMAAAVRVFAKETGRGAPAERYWRRESRP